MNMNSSFIPKVESIAIDLTCENHSTNSKALTMNSSKTE